MLPVEPARLWVDAIALLGDRQRHDLRLRRGHRLQHLLLDGIAGDDAACEDLTLLADAVRPVDRLRLDRRVPPRIEQKHVLRGGQIQTDAACLEADQEQLAFRIGLKTLDAALAVASSAVQVFVGDALAIEVLAQNRQHAGELRKHQRLVTLFDHFQDSRQ